MKKTRSTTEGGKLFFHIEAIDGNPTQIFPYITLIYKKATAVNRVGLRSCGAQMETCLEAPI